MADASDDLSLSFSSYKGTVSVAVTGPMEHSTAGELRSLLFDLIDDGEDVTVVIDLTGVSSIDPAGLSVLAEAAELLRENGGRLVITRPRPSTRKLLDLTGLDDVIAVTP